MAYSLRAENIEVFPKSGLQWQNKFIHCLFEVQGHVGKENGNDTIYAF